MGREAPKFKSTKHNLWIANTGASCHMCNGIESFEDIKEVTRTIIIGNGNIMKCTKVGTWKGFLRNKEGNKIVILLKEVSYIPTLATNLLSLTTVMNNGWELKGSGQFLKIHKGTTTIDFDKKVKSRNSFLLGFHLERSYQKESAMIISAKIG